MLFARNAFGPFGGVAWLQTAPHLVSHERAREQVSKDARYRAKDGESVGLFVKGSAHQVLGRRVA